MKKVFCVSLLALMLVCLLCASALAQTTGIAMDGKVYTFTGGEGTYQADGKTFIIGVESVVVQYCSYTAMASAASYAAVPSQMTVESSVSCPAAAGCPSRMISVPSVW